MDSRSERAKPSFISPRDSGDTTTTNTNKKKDATTSIINSKEQNSLLLFDLESYISRYDENSETRLQRLLFIARRAPSKDLAKSAFALLEKQLKENDNWRRYTEVFEGCPEVGGVGAGGEVGMDNAAVGAMSLKDSGGEEKEGDGNGEWIILIYMDE